MVTMRVLEAYFTLCKPRVVLLMLLTSWVGMILAEPGDLSIGLTLLALFGIGLAASSGAAINHLIDRHIDALMNRTKSRPLPRGDLSNRAVIAFATALGSAGFVILWLFVNVTTAILTMISLVGYAGVYTGFLKRKTPQNIVIGGLAGALPPLLGWTAVTNEIAAEGVLLVMIIFIWTPPHFWALAINRYEDYCRVKIPMLPVTHGIPFTKLNILLYSVMLWSATLLPFVISMTHLIYLVSSLILNAIFVRKSIQLYKADESSTPTVAMDLFRYSITYLTILFIVLCVDHFVVIDRFWGAII